MYTFIYPSNRCIHLIDAITNLLCTNYHCMSRHVTNIYTSILMYSNCYLLRNISSSSLAMNSLRPALRPLFPFPRPPLSLPITLNFVVCIVQYRVLLYIPDVGKQGFESNKWVLNPISFNKWVLNNRKTAGKRHQNLVYI